MAKLVQLANGLVDLKFDCTPKNFKRKQFLIYRGKVYRLYINKNDGVYRVTQCNVTEWVENTHTGRKYPNTWEETTDSNLMNHVMGNPSKIAVNFIMAEIDFKSNK